MDGTLDFNALEIREVPFIRFRKSLATKFPDRSVRSLKEAPGSEGKETVFIINGERIGEFLSDWALSPRSSQVPPVLGRDRVLQWRIEIEREPRLQEGNQRRVIRLILVGDIEIQDRFLSCQCGKTSEQFLQVKGFENYQPIAPVYVFPHDRTPVQGGVRPCGTDFESRRLSEHRLHRLGTKPISRTNYKEFGGSGGVHSVLSDHARSTCHEAEERMQQVRGSEAVEEQSVRNACLQEHHSTPFWQERQPLKAAQEGRNFFNVPLSTRRRARGWRNG